MKPTAGGTYVKRLVDGDYQYEILDCRSILFILSDGTQIEAAAFYDSLVIREVGRSDLSTIHQSAYSFLVKGYCE